ncbi:cilia- and flagella-associated protein 97-like [Denticeps clupeoides]|uniref:Cilia- and flagella-associated protein 97 n=1 Tax=Denticeps clupeoides TaxID=299321 RepID=A0AAY4BDV5_9TELE|nr:cilia- and flagella-associated protein 97 [Denticeps clupeoides]
MYSPRELEGEVDHSFFDSDCEDQGKQSNNREDDGKNKGNVDSFYPVSLVEQKAKEGQRWEGDSSSEHVGGDEQGAHGMKIDDSGRRDGEQESSKCDLDMEETVADRDCVADSNVSPSLSSLSEDWSKGKRSPSSGSTDGSRASSQVENDSDVEDGYHQSGSEEEDESLRGSQPCKRRVKQQRSFRISSPCPSLSSELESSYSSDEDCYSSPEPSTKTLPHPQATCSPRQSAMRASTFQQVKLKAPEVLESDDTITDVTPLSTPDANLDQTFELPSVLPLKEPKAVVSEPKQQNATNDLVVRTDSACEKLDSDQEASHYTDRSLLSLVSQVDSSLLLEVPGSRNRKNYSFTNEEVRRIDRENQRLLKELSRPSARSRNSSGTISSSKASSKRTTPPIRMYHSALNRQREQQRIERENLAFLKRLESVKPTPGMTRSEQLADFQRQTSYLGTSVSPSTSERLLSSYSSPGKSSRPCSTSSHRSRPACSTPAPTKLSRASAPRPAWS